MKRIICIIYALNVGAFNPYLHCAEGSPETQAPQIDISSQEPTTTSSWIPSLPDFYSTYDKIPTIKLPDFAKITEKFSDVFERAKPYLTNSVLGERLKNATPEQQSALLGALAIGTLYGGYKYSQYRTRSTVQLIDDSLEFIAKIMKNPQFLREAWDDTKYETNPGYIVLKKKADIINSLGLSLSTLNNKSYNQNPYKDIYMAVDDLSTDLTIINGFYKFIPNNEVKAEEARKEKSPSIEKNSIFLYLKLLQARNGYKPETLPLILRQINLSDYLEKQDKFEPITPIKNTYFIIQSYIQNPKDDLNITTLKNTVMQILFGGALYQIFRMPEKYKKEIPEFEELFRLISSKQDKNDIIRQAKRCRNIIANRGDFPETDKWLMVQDYLEQIKKPFTLQEEPRGKMVSLHKTQTEAPAETEFTQGLGIISRTPINPSLATLPDGRPLLTETREAQPAPATELSLFDNPWEVNPELTKSIEMQTYALPSGVRESTIEKLQKEKAEKSQTTSSLSSASSSASGQIKEEQKPQKVKNAPPNTPKQSPQKRYSWYDPRALFSIS